VADRFTTVDQFTLGVFRDKFLVPRVFDEAGNFGNGKVPVFLFPFRCVRGAVKNLLQPVLVGLRQIEETGPLGAKRALVDGMVGVAFDVEDLSRQLVHAADEAAAAGTVCANGAHLLRHLDAVHLVELVRISLYGAQVDAQTGQGNPRSDGSGHLQETPSGNLHRSLLKSLNKLVTGSYVNFDLCQARHIYAISPRPSREKWREHQTN